jgi:hypothetical protein
MKTYPPPYKFQFAAGPYTPPRVNAGVSIVDACYGKVKVAGFTRAPIPWPAHKIRGKLIPILTKNLVRALMEEPEAVVAHYFGVSKYSVVRWRKLLSGKETLAEIHATLSVLRNDLKFRKTYGYRK